MSKRNLYLFILSSIIFNYSAILATTDAEDYKTCNKNVSLVKIYEYFQAWENSENVSPEQLDTLIQCWKTSHAQLTFWERWNLRNHKQYNILVSEDKFLWHIIRRIKDEQTSHSTLNSLFDVVTKHFDKQLINKNIGLLIIKNSQPLSKSEIERTIALRKTIEQHGLAINYQEHAICLIAQNYPVEELIYAIDKSPKVLNCPELFSTALEVAIGYYGEKRQSLAHLDVLHAKLQQYNKKLDRDIFYKIITYRDRERNLATQLLLFRYGYNLNDINSKNLTFLDNFVIARNMSISDVKATALFGSKRKINETTLNYFKYLIKQGARFGDIQAVKEALPGIINHNKACGNQAKAEEFVALVLAQINKQTMAI
ncbi:hypothetical protein J120_02390 [candidate division TM6 bacterium JCVI TM6SC1]|uniref:Uncharacterized protein n=1 Tax=candidate division TM6 bacterium JCVI TM6SC1 TaxID=1306947 RepID=A0A0D2K4M2_9BACT|nr:hypothetical protein J120_02390 [candidate division TM6 bacterium JCVI TM6SC1]